jgi:hypothetical protein
LTLSIEPQVAAAKERTTFKRISREFGDLLDRPCAFLKERSGLRTDDPAWLRTDVSYLLG